MRLNPRAWCRWTHLLLAVWALATACVDPAKYQYSCQSDEDCAGLPGGGSYVCGPAGPESATRVCEPATPGVDAGEDAGTDDGGTDGGGTDGGMDGGPPRPACTPDPAPSCLADSSDASWCWDNPLSEGRTLYKIRGRSLQDVWAVGQHGLMLHWDGGQWTRCAEQTSDTLRAVWPGSEAMLWAGGGGTDGGTLLEWDGGSWRSLTVASPMIRDIAGAPDASVFAVGEARGTGQERRSYIFLRQDGSTWGEMSVLGGEQSAAPSFHAICAVPGFAPVAVGNAGAIWWFNLDVNLWSRANSVTGSPGDLFGITVEADNMIAVGNQSIMRGSNNSWNRIGTPYLLNDVWRDTDGGVTWTVGDAGLIARVEDTPVVQTPSSTQQDLYSIWGQGSRAWAVGAAGTILKLGDVGWAEAAGGVTSNINSMVAIGTEVWAAADNGVVMKREDGLWVPQPPVPPFDRGSPLPSLKSIWKVGNELLVLTSDNRIYRLENGSWVPEGLSVTQRLNALGGVGPHVWAVGNGSLILEHGADHNWGPVRSSPTGTAQLNAVWGHLNDPTSLTEVPTIVAVGSNGNGTGIVYLRRSTLSLATYGNVPRELFGVWGRGPSVDDIFVVGQGASILKHEPSQPGGWDTLFGSGNANETLLAISGEDMQENILHAWAVSDAGRVVMYDNGRRVWIDANIGFQRALRAVALTPDSVYVGGVNGAILKKAR